MKKLRIFSVIGTRPNFIKVAPLCRAFSACSDRVEHLLCHTGQHSDSNMSDIFFRELGMPSPRFFLGINNGTHGEITGHIMIEFEKVLIAERPDLVVVVGDVNSTMACALAAVKLGIKVAHVEAGLRSGDRSMPEEINRIVTDSISDYLFVTEQSGIKNLQNEGIPKEKIFFTGNIMIDSLAFLQKKIEVSSILADLKLQEGNYILVTFHRPSNVDSRENLLSLITFLNDISEKISVIFPIHPRTLRNIKEFGLLDQVGTGVRLIEPLGYLEFQALMHFAKIVITDSGGIQEETTYLGIQCLTVRDNTERPVTTKIGTNQLCGTDFSFVTLKVREILNGKFKQGRIPDLWDGHAAERIIDCLLKEQLHFTF